MLDCLPLECPEQGRFGENIKLPVEDVIKLINAKLGFSILPPQVEGGQFGLKIQDSIIGQRDIFALEAALGLKSISDFSGNSAFAEIGAGIGKVAYWSWQMGIKDYSIFDLPYISVISAFYLIKSLSPNAVLLYGEESNDSKNVIKIFPSWYFKNPNRTKIDVILNQDSFPEIDDSIVLDYLTTMKKTGIEYFLSINQESMGRSMSFEKRQGRVCILADQISGFHRLRRAKSWTRVGYVEELFQILKS